MAPDADRAHVRLAELVAALSLGIDLGFGQPMEHVLRECLIALRIAEGLGLDEEQRAGVYYTALLVNVGCHTDAHEQAKWFGDDIAMKSGKYDHDFRSVRSALSGLRMLGQSLAREFHPQGIHVVHIIVDGQIDTPRLRSREPDRARETVIPPDAIAATVIQCLKQPPTAWSQEIDIRPAVENF